MEVYRPPQAGQPPVSWVNSRAILVCFALVSGAMPKAEKLVLINAPAVTRSSQKRPALKLGTWNVRTMLTGISDDLRHIDDLRKTAVINNELTRLDVDIVALQKTRLPETACERMTSLSTGKVSQWMKEENMVWGLL